MKIVPPRVANNLPEEINKALINLAGLTDDAADQTALSAQIDALLARINLLEAAQTPAGTIAMWGTNIAPDGWLPCIGQAISRTAYAGIFAAIGTTWGAGDGSTTFNLPDSRGVFPKGAGTTNRAAGVDANGNFYAATVGVYLQDKMQGHRHGLAITGAGGALNGYSSLDFLNARLIANVSANVQDPTPDGVNGAPRTGLTTEPQSFAVRFIIYTGFGGSGSAAVVTGPWVNYVNSQLLDLQMIKKTIRTGGELGYAGVADTHYVRPQVLSVWYQGTPYVLDVGQASISNAMANYPAANAWAFITIDYTGTMRLRPGTGTLIVRPTNNFFQPSGGGVGYNDINRFGYYYADGERVVGAIGRVSATEFCYIHNHEEDDENGQFLCQIGGSGTLGVQTYTQRRGNYERSSHTAFVYGDIVITAKGAGIAGNVILTLPFAPNTAPGEGAGVRYAGSPSYASGFTYAARTWLCLVAFSASLQAQLLANGSAVGPAAITVANMAAASEITFGIHYDIG